MRKKFMAWALVLSLIGNVCSTLPVRAAEIQEKTVENDVDEIIENAEEKSVEDTDTETDLTEESAGKEHTINKTDLSEIDETDYSEESDVEIFSAESEIAVDENNFPDEAFRNWVGENCDTDNNGLLSEAEVDSVTYVSVASCGITSLDGIEYFSNMQRLSCGSNDLETLDVSKNINLERLECFENNLTELDISTLVNLKELHCSSNKISKLDLTNNKELEVLRCETNELTELDVTENPKLRILYFTNNKIKEIDVSHNLELVSLDIRSNDFSYIDISNNIKLKEILCDNNNLKELDVSHNIALEVIHCSSNNLTSLELSNLVNLRSLSCSYNELSGLDFSNLENLLTLSCDNNNLAFLNVSNQSNLMSVFCDNNTFEANGSSLDITTITGFSLDNVVNGTFQGGILNGNILMPTSEDGIVSYIYDIGQSYREEFRIHFSGNIEEVTEVVGDDKEENEVEFKFGTKIKLNFPDNYPLGFMAGDSLELDFSYCPIQFEADGNTFRLGIGTANMAELNDSDWGNFKKFVEKQDEDYLKGMNNILASKFGTASMGEKIKSDIKIYGYAEGVLGANGVDSFGGKVFIECKAKISEQWQTMIIVVPVVIKASLEVGVEANYSVGLDFESSTIYFAEDVDIVFPGVKASAGVGVAYVCDVSVYGSLENIINFKSNEWSASQIDITASLKGEIGASASVLFFEYKEVFFDNDDGWIYYTNVNSGETYSDAQNIDGDDSENRKSNVMETEWQISRFPNTSAWNGKTGDEGASAFALSDNMSSGTIYTLQSGIYENTNPVLVTTENGSQVLVYTADIESRSTGNHTAVCYSVYDAGSSVWSDPIILEDDGTADFDPVATVNGNEIYIAWVNADQTFNSMEIESESFVEELFASCEIRMAKLDIQNKSVDVYAVTDNVSADLRPAIAVVNRQVSVAWYESAGNDIITGNGEKILHLAQMNGNDFELKAEQILQRSVTGTAVGELDGECVAAFTLSNEAFNLDMTAENVPQTSLLLMDDKGNTNEISDKSVQSDPGFFALDSGSRLIWYAMEDGKSSLHYTESLSGTPKIWLDDEAILSSDYTLINGNGSQLLVCVADNLDADVDGRNLYAYVIEDDTIGEAIALTKVDGYTANPSGIWDGEKYVFLFTRTEADIGETLETTTDLCITAVIPQSGVAVDDTEYDAQALMPGATADVTVTIRNEGLSVSGATVVQILYGSTVIGETTFTTALEPGDSAEAVVSVTVPSDIPENAPLTVQVVSDKGNPSDTESVSISGASADVSLDVSEDEDTVTAVITNNSGFAVSTSLNISTIVTESDSGGQSSTAFIDLEPYETSTYQLSKEEWNSTSTGIVNLSLKSNNSDAFLSDNDANVYVGENGFKNLSHLVAKKRTTIYSLGDTLSLDDLEVRVVYEDGTEEEVTEYTTNIDEIDMSTVGEKMLIITYTEGFQTRKVEFPIVVTDDEGGVIKGDVNMDRKVSLQDLMMCLYHISGRSVLAGDAFTAADINNDGSITVADLMRMLYYVSGRNIEL